MTVGTFGFISLPSAVVGGRAVGVTGTLETTTFIGIGFTAADAFGDFILLVADTSFYQRNGSAQVSKSNSRARERRSRRGSTFVATFVTA